MSKVSVTKLLRERILGYTTGIVAVWQTEVLLDTGEKTTLYRTGRPALGTYFFGRWERNHPHIALFSGDKWRKVEYPLSDLGGPIEKGE